MKRFFYLLIMILTSIIISPINQNSLPDFYVEMLNSSGKKVCSAFIISSKTILTSVHCKNLTQAKFRDGSVKQVMRVYKSAEDDVAIYHIYEDGYHLDKYPTIGYSFDLGLLRIHSHVNNIKQPIFFILIDKNILQDVTNSPDILTIVDTLFPIGMNSKKGHSGSAVVQNGKIVGMVLGIQKEQSIPVTYSVQGLVLLKHLRKYQRIIEEVNQIIYSYSEKELYYEQ